QRIGFICGPPNRYKWRLNQTTFEETARRLKIEEVGSIVAPDYEEETAFHCLSRLIEQGARLPTAYISTSDILAIGLMKAAQEHNLSVPEDLSVVSYGDIPGAATAQPPLTTVGGDFVEIGAAATRMVIDMIEGELKEPVSSMIDLHLVLRKSTAPPSNRD
ncbi:MAG: LacI family DNA-binding transcriptional regulator, partial [Candidatus Omnitrophica bacterium]|nr:LacI family DNA-binding transcriptional regulator [Candidatus Omnitrophota bacterium]